MHLDGVLVKKVLEELHISTQEGGRLRLKYKREERGGYRTRDVQ